MNTFAGNITLKQGSIDIEKSDFDIVFAGGKTYFLFWEIDVESSKEVLEYFIELYGEIESYDISISTEDELEIVGEWYSEWMYELVSFEWADVSFDTISQRFEEVEEACVVREAKKSKKFGNRIVKVDFLY